MSSTSRAWLVAASVGVVEALKDQGICRWNNVPSSLQQEAMGNITSHFLAKKLSSPTTTSHLSKKLREQKMRKSEESLRTVMYLSCWGPN